MWLLGAAAFGLALLLAWALAGGSPESAAPAGVAAGSRPEGGDGPQDARPGAASSGAPSLEPGFAAPGEAARAPVRETWSSAAGPAFTLSGRVALADGAPVTSFLIEVFEPGVNASGHSTRSLKASGLFEAADGEFELERVPAGEWVLGVRADDHLTVSGGGPLALQADTRVELVLVREGRVRGVVLDPTGRQVEGARILPFPDEPETDAEGRFDLPAARGGPGLLWANAAGFGPSEVVDFDLQPGEGLDLELRLVRGARVTGEVLDDAGLPQPGIDVDLGNFAGERRLRGMDTETDEAGRFAFEDLPAGTFLVMADQDDPASSEKVRAEQVTLAEGESVHLVLDGRVGNPILLRVAVTRASRPVSDCRVYAFPEGPGLLANAHQGRPDEQGRFELTLDRPGSYVLSVDARGRGRDSLHSVHVPAEPVVDVAIALPAGRLAGRVVTAAGDPVAGKRVWTDREGEWSPISLGMGRSIHTGEDGAFAFEGLQSGTWSVAAEGARPRHGILLAADGSVEDLRLVRGETGAVRGRVLGPDGAPAAGVAVFARDAHGRWIDSFAPVASRPGTGEFEWRQLPPGDYTFVARHRTSASAESGPVRVTADAETSVELSLAPGAMLRVSLVDSEGGPVPASFRVFDAEGRSFETLQSPYDLELFLRDGHRSNGRHVGPLPPARYTVEARAADGRVASRKVKVAGGDDEELVLRVE